MKVKHLMTPDVKTCDLNESLAGAAKLMWDNDCGILPVLKDGYELVGIITDRDICMGAAMRDRVPSSVSVEEVMTGTLFSVSPDDDIHLALETMKKNKVRRLPVVDDEGKLQGLVSMNDVVLNAREPSGKKTPALGYSEVVRTYQAICEHPQAMQAAAASTG